jgi:hypothetical protein
MVLLLPPAPKFAARLDRTAHPVPNAARRLVLYRVLAKYLVILPIDIKFQLTLLTIVAEFADAV